MAHVHRGKGLLPQWLDTVHSYRRLGMRGAPGVGPGLALRPLLIFHTFLLSAIFSFLVFLWVSKPFSSHQLIPRVKSAVWRQL